MSEVKEWWVCSICGPATWSSANWCDGGCGSDYREMTKLVLPHELREQIAQEYSEKLLLLARYANKDELDLIRYEDATNIARGK